MSVGASLGVLIPTRNSAALLPPAIEALNRWIELADEVVVMDSFSTDGTVDLLRANLKHRNIRFCSNPPGLYASWNAGLQQLTTPFAYISTVGDTITGEGVRELLRAATSLDVDVVISKPVFKRPSGEVVPTEWPIDDMVRSLQIDEPRRLHPLEVAVFAAVHATQALTGSCASNVFRTQVLQRLPFPTEFGTVGDNIWSLRHAPRVSWAVVPQPCSMFLMHSTTLSQKENKPKPGVPREDAILRSATTAWIEERLLTTSELGQIQWDEMLNTLTGYLDAKTAFDAFRRGKLPWILAPAAWQTRARRTRLRRRLQALKEQALARVASLGSVGAGQKSGRPAGQRAEGAGRSA
ncbi:MAG: glycosyltransferase [Verrucomicrobiota bacterium]